ncbi:cytochrome P450 monooxygenase [Aureobasidium pullulans]|uniref:Cytochrome P450 monooxygenase n=1 Tax=Aureobasidium pullulans TaxID=5580 RepID=A0A4S9L9P7_AURPU|nr:cytochrome P450 monooxygenase [Aureobasidium pullulans]
MVMVMKRALLLAAVALSFSVKSFAPGSLLHGSVWQSTVAIFLSMLAVRFSWTCLLYPLCFSPLRHLPHPKQTSLLLGQFSRIIKEPTGYPHREWMEEIENDGLIYYRGIFNMERVMVTTPKALSEAVTLKSYDLIKPPTLTKGLARILGYGILLTEGQEHKTQRKNLTPAFSYRHVKDLYPVFWEQSRDMILGIDKDIESKATDEDETKQTSSEVNVDGWTSRATLDIIGVATIGKSFGAIEDDQSELYRTYQTLFKQDWQTRMIGLLNFILPFWFLRALPIPRNVKVEKARVYLSKICFEMLAEKRSKIAAAKEKDKSDEIAGGIDILSVAMQSGGFTDGQVVDQLLTFLAAGHETTATAMTWAVYVLGKHSDVQQKLCDELRASPLPDIRDTGAKVTAEQIEQLPYLHAVVNEVLRFYCPIPMTIRIAEKDVILAGHPIPKGTTVLTPLIAANHNSAMWSEDPKVFNPERWMGPGRANTGGAESNYSNMTFSHGPRGCIGASFAKAEFACLLAAWVLGFETTLVDPDMETDVTGGIIRRIKGGLRVKVVQTKS